MNKNRLGFFFYVCLKFEITVAVIIYYQVLFCSNNCAYFYTATKVTTATAVNPTTVHPVRMTCLLVNAMISIELMMEIYLHQYPTRDVERR
jgi:hypothetical protein